MNESVKRDWMLVQVRGYNIEKGYIYATTYPDGVNFTIAQKQAKGGGYFKPMTNTESNTYVPAGSVVAVYGIEQPRAERNFCLASWCTPISKDLSQEDVYVTPIKVASTAKKVKPDRNGKEVMALANVLDKDPIPVNDINDFRNACLQAINDNTGTSIPIKGPRGFMVRVGSLDGADKSSCISVEFFGKPGNTPLQTWDWYVNQKPAEGRQKNTLKSIASRAKSALNHPNGYVEIVGVTRAILNDFGREENVHKFTTLPNYKREEKGKTVDAYSLAAVVVSKQGTRNIKAQHPLPRNKFVTHLSGVLGRHAGLDMPAVITNIESAPTKTVQAAPAKAPQQPAPAVGHQSDQNIQAPAAPTQPQATNAFPLQINNHINQDGEVRNFMVNGTREALALHKDRIFAAGRGVKPYAIDGGKAYIFPLNIRNIVEASLHDLAGTPPFYLATVVENGQNYIAIEGDVENPKYFSGITEIEQRLDGVDSHGKMLIHESRRPELMVALKQFAPAAAPNLAPAQAPAPTAPDTQVSAATPASAPTAPGPQNTTHPRPPNFGQWLMNRFGNDPYQMMDFLDADISSYAEQAGIDWSATRGNVHFGTGQKSDIVKGNRVVPLSPKDKGSVAVAATAIEKLGRNPGESIVYFSIRFWNKKLLKDDTVDFKAYPALKEAHEFDISSGSFVKKDDEELERIKRDGEARAANALRQVQEDYEKAQRSVQYWAKRIPTLDRETGDHPYWKRKNIEFIVEQMDIRAGVDQYRGKFAVYPLYDINDNFVGAQRLFEKPFAADGGKSSDKDFITGTGFNSPEGIPLGTHAIIGSIAPGESIIHYCEGLATAASIHDATKQPVVICLNKDNLSKVIPLFRDKYPVNRHVCAYDNDAFKPKAGNSGYLAAVVACAGTDIRIAGPNFSGLDINDKPTDFNDLHVKSGVITVRDQITAATLVPSDPVDLARLKVTLAGTNKLDSMFQELSKEIAEATDNDLTEANAAELLYVEAIHHYGANVVMATISVKYLEDLGLDSSNKSDPKEENLNDISVSEYVGQTGKKSILIKDHAGNLSEKIEDTLKYFLPADKVIFNKVLNGWFAPFGLINLVNTFLHEHTGSPQLYIGKSKGLYNGEAKLVVKGDFRDPSVIEKISNIVKDAKPEFKKREQGLVIWLDDSKDFVTQKLRSYLTNTPSHNAAQAQVESQQIADTPEAKEARNIAGITSREQAIAVAKYENGTSNTATLSTDHYYLALYAAALNKFSDIGEHEKPRHASKEAILRARSILEHQDKYDLSAEAKKSLQEIVLHYEIAQELGDGDPRRQISTDIIYFISEQREIAEDDVAAIVSGSKSTLSTEDQRDIVNQYRELLVGDIASLEARQEPAPQAEPPTAAIADQDRKINELEVQSDRAQELLLIVRSAIEKGFEYEDFYNSFLTQAGSPYFDTETQKFDESLLNIDLRFLSSPDTILANWDNQKIVSASGLFAHEHGKIGRHRLDQFEAFVISFIEQRGALGFRGFSRYLTGEVPIDGPENPYMIDDELDEDLLKSDLAYFTDFHSVNAFYRDISQPFADQSPPETDADLFVGPLYQTEAPIAEKEMVSLSTQFGTATINAHAIDGSTVYQLKLNAYIEGQPVAIWKDHSLRLAGLEAQANRWTNTFTGDNTAAALPTHIMKAELNAVMIDTTKIEGGNDLVFTELADDKTEFYIIEKSLPVANGYVTEFITGTKEFNATRELYREMENELAVVEPDTENDQDDIGPAEPEITLSESPKADSAPNKLKTLFNRWSLQGATWDFVKRELGRELNVEFTAGSESAIQAQYESLLEKQNAPSIEEVATERYAALYAETTTLATDGLIYDDYLEEFFKPEGMIVDRNPYFDAEAGTIDRSTAMGDLRSAGYNSLTQFYEGIFKSIHNRTSNEFVLGRVGGYIPESINTDGPLRPQFASLAAIFDKAGLGQGQAANFIPPYAQWVESPESARLAHPIFSEDLTDITSEALVSKYSHDELLMLADVHGIPVTAENDSETVVEKTLALWSLRQGIAEVGISSLRDMDPEEVVNILDELKLSTSGAHDDRSRRLAGYVDNLQSTSQLRIAQYSYIQTALQTQAQTGRLPSYVSSAISSFINTESAFLDAADRAIEETRRAVIRINIDRVMAVVGAENQPVRSALGAIDYGKGQIVGIDTRKKLALTFSDKQLEDNAKLARYTHTYALPDGVDVADVLLPNEITHYAIFDKNIIGTAVALNNDHLLTNNIIPISGAAVVSACAPLSDWLHNRDYLAFEDAFGNQQFALKTNNTWQTFAIRDGSINALRGYRNEKDLIKSVATSISSFNDRDVLIEAFIDECRLDYKQALDKLQDFTSNQVSPETLAALAEEIAKPEFNDYLKDYREEDVDVQVNLLTRALDEQIRQQAWEQIVSSTSNNPVETEEKVNLSAIDRIHSLAKFTPYTDMFDTSPDDSGDGLAKPAVAESTPATVSEVAEKFDSTSADYDAAAQAMPEAAEVVVEKPVASTPVVAEVPAEPVSVPEVDAIELTGAEYKDIVTELTVLETVIKQAGSAVFLFPDGQYQTRMMDEVIPMAEIKAALEAEEKKKIETMTNAEKHGFAQDMAIGQTLDMFGFLEEPDDDDALTEEQSNELNNSTQGVVATVDASTGEISVGEIDDSQDEVFLNHVDVSNDPDAPSFEDFKKTPAAHEAHQSFLAHDPRSAEGIDNIAKLPFEQVEVLAKILDLPIGHDKAESVARIGQLGVAISSVQQIVSNNSAADLTDEGALAINKRIGIDPHASDAVKPLAKWLIDHAEKTQNRLALHNYQYLHGSAIRHEPNRFQSPIDDDTEIVHITDVHMTPAVFKELPTIEAINEAFRDKEHHAHAESIAAISQIGVGATNFDDLVRELENANDKDSEISIIHTGGELKYDTAYGEFDSLQSAVHGVLHASPVIHQHDAVECLIEGKLMDVGVEEDAYHGEKVIVSYRFENSVDVTAEIDLDDIITPLQEQQIADNIQQALSKTHCPTKDLGSNLIKGMAELMPNSRPVVDASIAATAARLGYQHNDFNLAMPAGHSVVWDRGDYALHGPKGEVKFNGNFAVMMDRLASEALTNNEVNNGNDPELMGADNPQSYAEPATPSDSRVNEERAVGGVSGGTPATTGGQSERTGRPDPVTTPADIELPGAIEPREPASDASQGHRPTGIVAGAGNKRFQLSAEHDEFFKGTTALVRAEHSLTALQLRKEINDSGRDITPDDKEILSRYTGFAGIAQVFDNNSHYGRAAEIRRGLSAAVTTEEYAQIKSTVNSAYYTPADVIKGVWQGVQRMGFDGGRVLDPSAGIGHFVGAAPESLTPTTQFIAREIDPVSTDIAQMLYGKDLVKNEAFEKTRFPAEHFDLAISNIPFGDMRVNDPDYNRHKLMIHDYFTLKALDKVRSGGLVAFITSTGTMDKANSAARELLLEKADLVGAIRLPNNTFSSSAGTAVASDILFLRKREPNLEPQFDTSWVTRSNDVRSFDDDEWASELNNDYYAKNPEMVIGEVKEMPGRHGPELHYIHEGPTTILEEIQKRIALLPESVMGAKSTKPAEIAKQELNVDLEDISHIRKGCYVYSDKQFGIVSEKWNDETATFEPCVEAAKVPKTHRGLFKDYIELRDTTREVLAIQSGEHHDIDLKNLQSDLAGQYMRFVATYGHIQRPEVKKILRVDPDFPVVAALEQPADLEGTIRKSDIFHERIINNFVEPTHYGNSSDAVLASLRTYSKIVPNHIEKLTGKQWDEIRDELGTQIFKNPKTSSWEMAEQYLSGHILNKLNEAKQAAEFDPEYQKNIAPLQDVMPSPIPPYDIEARLGSTWVPTEEVGRFMAHMLNDESDYKPSQYQVAQAAGLWRVDVGYQATGKGKDNNESKWGTKRVPFVDLMEKILNSRQIKVFDPDGEGGRVLNRDETLAANEKGEEIKAEFKQWLWQDKERGESLAKIYNEQINVFVEPNYSAKGLSLNGMATHLGGKPLEPYDTQLASVRRYLVEGRALLAHPVGAGKTLELVASAILGKQYGVHSKPLVVVPNNVLSQFGNMAREMFPNSKVLIASKKDLEKNNRKAFTARIATSNWDMVVVPMSVFGKISTPIESQRRVIQEEKFKLSESLQRLGNEPGNHAATLSIKRIEKKLEKLSTNIEKLADGKLPDDHINLKETGVDALFVDEADNFLNLTTPTQMSHIPGVNSSAAQQAMAMLMAVRYIQDLNGDNKGVVFATGTDVRNSMSDMYTMLRYIGPDVLESAGVESFDEFMGAFGEVVNAIEINPEGTGYRQNSRLSRFVNVPELVMLYRQIADVLVSEQLNLKKPQIDEINVVAEPCKYLDMYMADLSRRATACRGGGVDPSEDNILKISHNGKQASLDMRLIDPRIPDNPESKINLCVKNVAREYEDGRENKLVQVIFCDQGTPGGSSEINLYQDIKDKLVAKGIPANEIVFAHDFNTDARKDDMQAKLNQGIYRVVIGSTEKLGVGNNIQTRLVAEHDLDPPWRPRDVEQRNGRMDRPGNTNAVARKYTYATKDSFDLFMWETLKRKANFIYQTKVSPRDAARVIDEDMTPNYSEIMAITTGNPLIKEKMDLDSKIEKLEAGERIFNRQDWQRGSEISELKRTVDANKNRETSLNQIIPDIANKPLFIGKNEITDHKEGGKLLKAIIAEFEKRGLTGQGEPLKIGQIGDTPIKLNYLHTQDRWVASIVEDVRRFTLSDNKIPSAMVSDLMSASNTLEKELNRTQRVITRADTMLQSLEAAVGGVYPHIEELKTLRVKSSEIEGNIAEMAENDQSSRRHPGNFHEELNKLNGPGTSGPGM